MPSSVSPRRKTEKRGAPRLTLYCVKPPPHHKQTPGPVAFMRLWSRPPKEFAGTAWIGFYLKLQCPSADYAYLTFIIPCPALTVNIKLHFIRFFLHEARSVPPARTIPAIGSASGKQTAGTAATVPARPIYSYAARLPPIYFGRVRAHSRMACPT